VLEIREVAKPSPRDGEVLVRIAATTVTAGDVVLRKMRGPLRLIFGLAFGLGKNKILGHELAGDVEAIGKDVSRFGVGDRVFATTGNRGGANAEYICLPGDGLIAAMPANMSFEEAAAVPVGGITALCILRKAAIQPGQKVLIYGASGSVGTYAVQLARHFGAEVTGVCSTANLEMVKSIGAHRVLDYTREDFLESAETYDVVFDAVGKLPSDRNKKLLKETGTSLTVNSSISESTEDLLFLQGLLEAGELNAVIDRRYPMEEIVEAHRYVEQGHKKGNVVITVAGAAANE
jgi:NADPH:quinone reductase-like Zn-dependent oxidoreductase